MAEFKTETSNQENVEKAAFQPSDFLDQLKAIDGHIKWNTLKRRQSIIDQLSLGTFSVGFHVVKENSIGSMEKVEKRSRSDILAKIAEGISSLATIFAKKRKSRFFNCSKNGI